MKKVKYLFSKEKLLVSQEDQIFKRYCEEISAYCDAFKKYGCTLNIGRVWINTLKNEKSNIRLPFKNGYSCYVYCDVEVNNKVVCCNSDDGEVDYYEATASWCISSISRCFFQSNVFLWNEINDIDVQVKKLLKMVSEASIKKAGDG